MRRLSTAILLGVVLFCAHPQHAHAQDFPNYRMSEEAARALRGLPAVLRNYVGITGPSDRLVESWDDRLYEVLRNGGIRFAEELPSRNILVLSISNDFVRTNDDEVFVWARMRLLFYSSPSELKPVILWQRIDGMSPRRDDDTGDLLYKLATAFVRDYQAAQAGLKD